MDVFWFYCFLITTALWLYTRNNAKHLSSKIADANNKLISAKEFLEKAKIYELKSKELKEEALDMQGENEVKRQETASLRRQVESDIEMMDRENRAHVKAVDAVVNLWVNESWKNIAGKLTADNFFQQSEKLKVIFDTLNQLSIVYDEEQESIFFSKLKEDWLAEKEAQRIRDEQDRVKQLMREELKTKKLRDAELKKLAKEQKELEQQRKDQEERIRALQELETLKEITEQQKVELEQALEKNSDLAVQIQESQRRQSMAELTKAGHIYVISNVGSFGQDVFKVGMTRRLIPEERVKELGDASVPFPFDIHLMISTEDAPALELKLHNELWETRLNLVNDRREFFRTDINTIKQIVDRYGGGVLYEFKPTPEASQWRESELRRKNNDLGVFDQSVLVEDDDELDSQEEVA